jgi:hypothetical protein
VSSLRGDVIDDHEVGHKGHYKCPLTISSHHPLKEEVGQDDYLEGLFP